MIAPVSPRRPAVLLTAALTVAALAPLTLAPPASADGQVLSAVVTYAAPQITVRAQPGQNNRIDVNWLNVPGNPAIFVDDPDDNATSHVVRVDATCGEYSGDYIYQASCGAAGDDPTALIDLGDGDDVGVSSNSNARGHRADIYGGDGNDTLAGSASVDYLYGGPGDDRLTPDGGVLDVNGGDVVSGGPGVDTLIVHRYPDGPMRITLDGVADDGETGENDNYGADIENVIGARSGPNIIVANSAVNNITGGDFPDTINVLDGVADTVDCGPSTDTVIADRIDILTNCESVTYPPLVASPGTGGADAKGATLKSTKLKVARGTATTKVRCAAGGPRCRGKIVVRAGKAKLAAAAYSAKPGKTDKVTLKVSTKARRLLAKKKTVKVVVSLKPQGGAALAVPGVLKR